MMPRPGIDLELSIVEWDEETGYRVVLYGHPQPDGHHPGERVPYENRRVGSYAEALDTALAMLTDFKRRAGMF